MKVSLNVKFLKGPYGGGMQFASSLKQFLLQKNLSVVNTLEDDDIDIILHIAPLPFQEICSYSYTDAYIYKLKHPKVAVVLRINECDERKNTNYMNQALIRAGKYVDSAIFISTWLKELFFQQGFRQDIPTEVILNGANTDIFNMKKKEGWDHKTKMRIVTHHWGGNEMKGHDIYKELDTLLMSDKEIQSKFEFTFIGNIPSTTHYKHTNIIQPLAAKTLAEELKTHHIYLTATRNEPAGMHHIEGSLCGLPILFFESGALPEYCHEYGIMFQKNNFRDALLKMYEDYDVYFERMPRYSNTAEKMCQEFYAFFLKIKPLQLDTHIPQSKIITWIHISSFFYFSLLRIRVFINTIQKIIYAKVTKKL